MAVSFSQLAVLRGLKTRFATAADLMLELWLKDDRKPI
ncbi:hypothetical protein IMCC3088_2139 [Aequoribacter fuscus]|uniref:Uncharacterized protein n=1 Tax=Aequoribacter fuscus TaxID=2518989 RepID=F3L3E7_9GAMM|nr:hypothetical protein IMCC3088_2139 [Aequoribacter fuscus]